MSVWMIVAAMFDLALFASLWFVLWTLSLPLVAAAPRVPGRPARRTRSWAALALLRRVRRLGLPHRRDQMTEQQPLVDRRLASLGHAEEVTRKVS